ncbi:MAG: DedA family protein [Deltaproteobacteria bacterium]|nr:DedA family protein [Deltaproteobacteria bacterium]
MELLLKFIDIFLHLDIHLKELIETYGFLTHFILFAIIFCETGLVVTPFLPGDSLLFAAGAFAAIGGLRIELLFPLLAMAAFLGDNLNYWIGSQIGAKAFTLNSRFLRREYLERTQRFYAKHGGKTVIIARFIPIVRTFAPFVAGIGAMRYSKFIGFSVLGSFLWMSVFLTGGYFFGNIPMVKRNFTLVILAIIVISVMPMALEWWKARVKQKAV